MSDAELHVALERAKERLDMLDWCPEPVRVDRARIVVAPWFFRVTGFRRYRGYALWRTILLRSRRGGPWPKRPLQGSDPRV